MKINLKVKISFVIILVIIFFGSLTGLIVYRFAEEKMFDIKKQGIINSNIAQALELNQIFNRSTQFSKLIAIRTRLIEYLSSPNEAKKKELQNIFYEYKLDDNRYLAIYLLNKEGKALISTDLSFIDQNYSFRNYFKYAINGFAYNEALLGKTSNQFGFYFSQPVIDAKNKVIGVVVSKLDPKEIEKPIINSQIAKESNLMLADSNGVIVFSSKKDRYLKSLGPLNDKEIKEIELSNKYSDKKIIPLEYNIIQQAIRDYKKPVVIDFICEEDKEREIISLVKVGNYPFYLISEIDTQEILNSALSIAGLLGLGVFFASVIATLFIIYFVGLFLKPLGLIIKYTEKISRGVFNEKINIKSGDEIEDLANTINRMTFELSGLYGNLEKRVKEQTQNLNLKISELENNKSAMLNLLEDIETEKNTSLRLTEDLEKFKLAVDNASDHIVITDSEGIIIYANKSVERITGFLIDEIIGKKAGSSKLWGGLMDKKIYQKFWNQIKEKRQIFIGEFNNHRKNGEKYIALASVSPIINNDKVQYFIGIERDITKEKEIDRMKTEFISLASHQLRTPLSAMRWFLEMLLTGDLGKLTKEQKDVINNIDQSNNRMIGLVNSLLNISRIESGRIIIDPHPTDLKKLLEGVIIEIKPKLNEKKQKCILSIHKNLPLINIDEKLIRNVYQNLLTNAVKYIPNNSEIIISISKKEKTITSQIEDSGYGIPLNEQDKVFNKFYRGSNAVKKETEGNGLGLYLAKSIIESSGGKIWFKSSEKGTSFYFELPLTGSIAKKGEVTISS